MAEQTHGELGTACAHQTGDTKNLALADIERNIIDDLLIGVNRVINGPVLDLHGHVADLHIMTLGETVGHFTTDHAADDAIFGNIIHTLDQSLDGVAVADNGDVVRNIRNLIELMRDNNRG